MSKDPVLFKQARYRKAEQASRVGRRGIYRIITNRDHLIVAFYEMFFRRGLGERYFNKGVLFALIMGLMVTRFFLNFRELGAWFSSVIYSGLFVSTDGLLGASADHYPFCAFDLFIVITLLLGMYHLYDQKQMIKAGVPLHSYFIGISRFAFLGKYFNSKNPHAGAYVYVEPFIALVFGFFCLGHNFVLGLLAIWGAGRLWYESYHVVSKAYHEEKDIEDGDVKSREVKHHMEEVKQRQSSSPPPIPKHYKPSVPPPIPPIPDIDKDLTPMEALRRLNEKKEANKLKE